MFRMVCGVNVIFISGVMCLVSGGRLGEWSMGGAAVWMGDVGGWIVGGGAAVGIGDGVGGCTVGEWKV